MKKPLDCLPVHRAGMQKTILTLNLVALCLILGLAQAYGYPDSKRSGRTGSKEKISSVKNDQQQTRVTGKITDEKTGDALPGVNIVVEGTTIGVTSDMNGNYNIMVPGENVILVFTFVGFNSERAVVGRNTVINMALKEMVSALEEVVVIGYGTQKKVSVTGLPEAGDSLILPINSFFIT